MDLEVLDCGCPLGAECAWLASHRSQRHATPWMSIVRLLMLAGFCVLVSAGCELTEPTNDTTGSEPQPTVDAAVIWCKLAEYVDHGIIESRHELSAYVKALADNGDLQPADVSAFDAAIPQAPGDFSRYMESRRSTDSQTLRGIR